MVTVVSGPSKKQREIFAKHGKNLDGSPAKSRQASGGGGKGGGEPAKPKYDVNAKGWSDQVAKFNKKGGINNDGKFGYGYVDTNTGIEVPWYIDMINGGGANAAGPEFISPFEDAPLGGGMVGIASQGVTGMANALPFVTPYGSEQARRYAQPGMVGYDHLSPNKPAPTGVIDAVGGSRDSSPRPMLRPSSDRPLTGTADMPPGLLPMTHLGSFGPNSAFNQLYDRLGGVEPDNSYAAEKSLIELAAYANSPYTDNLTDEEYGDLMPPQLPQSPDASSPANTAMTTPGMDFLMNMAQNTVLKKYPTMPAEEQRLRIDQEYQKLAQMLGY